MAGPVNRNEPWAGFFINMEEAFDFSSENTITLQVWAPITEPFRIKLEEQANTSSFVEIDTEIFQANTWQEISFDFSGSPAAFDRLVMFPGWNVPNAKTFHLDDITRL